MTTEGLEAFELVCGILVGTIGLVTVWVAFKPISKSSFRSQRHALRLLLGAIGFFALQELLGGTNTLLGEIVPEVGFEIVQEVAEISLILCIGIAFYLLRKSESVEVSSLRYAADFDYLTGLNNHSYFRRVAPRRIETAIEHSLPLCCLMVDVDNFKAYNDRFGHEAGNVVLSHVAHVLRECARADDLLARYGGEEFVLFIGSDLKAATEVAERVRSEIENRYALGHDACGRRQITVSVGVAPLTNETGTLEELVAEADKAMYRAKRLGKNRIVDYSPQNTIEPLDLRR